MYRSSESDLYNTEYLAWPDIISRRCDLCGSVLKFAHADNGKLVHTLQGDIHQIVYYYTCPTNKCENSTKYLNPAPRYDYDRQYFGKDVLQRVSREIFIFKQNPEQIQLRLTLDYGLEISLRTVQRMFNDCILIKSHKIDEETLSQIQNSKGIVMAADAQDPGAGMEAIWLFTDCLSGRVLHTVQTKSMPNEAINQEIEEILERFDTKLLGFVSDKQNSLVKCMKKFHSEIPHQYCTWHFTKHLWEHLDVFDCQIYTSLKTGINSLAIHARSASSRIYFTGHGKLPIREVFSDIDNDLQRLIKYRSKIFQFLRGLALYRGVKRYVNDLNQNLHLIETGTKFAKYYLETLQSLQILLDKHREQFFETLFMYDTFKLIYSLLYIPTLKLPDRQQQIDDVFGKCWAVAKIKEPSLMMEELRTFNTKASSTCPTILGEWVRLWNSYLPGLFQYYKFPISTRTNIDQERAFSIEKTALNRRIANSEVGVMQELQGEFYLRFAHCTTSELQKNIVDDYMATEVRVLRDAYHNKVKKITQNWFFKAEPLKGIDKLIQKYGIQESELSSSKPNKKRAKTYKSQVLAKIEKEK